MVDRRERDRREAPRVNPKKDLENRGMGFTPTAFDVPKGLGVFRFKKVCYYYLNVMPYIVSDRKIDHRFADPGVQYYRHTYWIHDKIGPNSERHCCLWENFKERCPVCEHWQLLNRQGKDWKTHIAPFRPKERVLFCFDVLPSNKYEEEGLYIFETAQYKMFGDLLDAKIELIENDNDPQLNFDSLTEGFTLKVGSQKDTMEGGREYIKPVSIEFIPRKVQYTYDKIDEIPPLDTLPKKLSYKELYRLFNQMVGDEDESEDKKELPPALTRSTTRVPVKAAAPDPDDDEDDEHDDEDGVLVPAEKKNGKSLPTAESRGIQKRGYVTYQGKECEVVHISADGTSLSVEDEGGEIFKGVGVDEVKVVKVRGTPSVVGEDEPPPARAAKPAPKVAVDDPDDDQDEDDKEDEPVVRKRR